MANKKKPNIVFVLTDQWRAQATGYAGDPNVQTPHLDSLRISQERGVNEISWRIDVRIRTDQLIPLKIDLRRYRKTQRKTQ